MKTNLLSIIAVVAISVFGIHAQRAEEIKIPFELYKSRIYVNAFVNDRGPFRFMVDTGASGIGRADVKLVKDLSIKTTGTTTNSDGITTSTISTVEPESIRLGPLTRRNVELLSRDYNTPPYPDGHLYGLIGPGFFEDYLLTIDYGKKEIVLTKDSLTGSMANVSSYKDTFSVPVSIGRHEAVVKLDTGSTLEMHLPKVWAEKLGIQDLKEAGKGYKANTVLQLFSAELPVSVKIGGNVISKVNAHFSERAPQINLGGAFLERNRCVVSIDQKNHLVRMVCRGVY